MTKITKAAARTHAAQQVGAVHLISAPNGYGYNIQIGKRGWTTTQSMPYRAAVRSRSIEIKAHTQAALEAQSLDTESEAYRDAYHSAYSHIDAATY